MAYKCKVCGYRFKSSDDDLCPQCFTARDDVKCSDSPGHSHGFDVNNERNSFLDEEKLRESIPSAQELNGQAHRAADELKKKYQTYQNDKHTYSGNPRASATAKYVQQQRQNAYNSGNSYDAYKNFMQQRQNQQVDVTAVQKKIRIFVVLFILAFFVLPLVVELIKSGIAFKKAADTSDDGGGVRAVQIEKPDPIDLPSIPDFSSLADGFSIYDYDYENSNLELAFSQNDQDGTGNRLINENNMVALDFAGVTDEQMDYVDQSLKGGDFYAYYIDFFDENGDSVKRTDCTCVLSAVDANSLPVYYFIGNKDQELIVLNNDVQFYMLMVNYVDAEGYSKTMYYEFSLDDFLTYVQ